MSEPLTVLDEEKSKQYILRTLGGEISLGVQKRGNETSYEIIEYQSRIVQANFVSRNGILQIVDKVFTDEVAQLDEETLTTEWKIIQQKWKNQNKLKNGRNETMDSINDGNNSST